MSHFLVGLCSAILGRDSKGSRYSKISPPVPIISQLSGTYHVGGTCVPIPQGPEISIRRKADQRQTTCTHACMLAPIEFEVVGWMLRGQSMDMSTLGHVLSTITETEH